MCYGRESVKLKERVKGEYMKKAHLVLKILLIASFIVILVGVVNGVETILFLNRAIYTDGTVTNLIQEERVNKKNKKYIIYRPEIQFKTENGEVGEFISLEKSSDPSKFSIGSKVKILYDNTQINNAKIDSFNSLWDSTIIAIIIGVVQGLIILGAIYIPRRTTKQPVYTFEIGGKEIKYLFKINKLCPVCNGNLKREKYMIDQGVGLTRWDYEDTYGKTYKVQYNYKCIKCQKSFSIEELS